MLGDGKENNVFRFPWKRMFSVFSWPLTENVTTHPAREYDSLLRTGHDGSRIRFAPTYGARTVGADGIRDTTPGEAAQLANTMRQNNVLRFPFSVFRFPFSVFRFPLTAN